MEGASSSTTTMQSRQKRVLPSRSTRGGPGVGNCDMDMLILDTQKRRSENEPLIPTSSRFLFTTDSSYSVEQDDSLQPNIKLNTVAFDRYFEKAEVLQAFRDQATIETPVFESIAELTSVGGRFRPRGAEDESAETSDAAYERRHKKYEAAEKRHRSREKEKLKHEHYKLKERIDQLRAMDSTAFMSVPASYFSPPPPGLVGADQSETPTSSVYTTAFNGPTPNPEGDRRKEEMLNMAMALEQRYRALLPSEKHRKAHEINIPESSIRTQVVEEESESERVPHARKDDSLKLRLPPRNSNNNTPIASPSVNRNSSKKSHQSNVQAKLPQAVRVLKQANYTVHSPAPSILTAEPSAATTPSADIEMGTPEPLETSVPISPSQPPLSDERSSSNFPPVYLDHVIPPIVTVSAEDVAAAPEKKKKTYKKKKTPVADGPSTKQTNRRGTGTGTGRLGQVQAEAVTNEGGESEKDSGDEAGPVKPTTKGKSRNGKGTASARASSRPSQPEADEVAPEVKELATRMQQATVAPVEWNTTIEVPEIAVEPIHPASEEEQEQDELIATPPPEPIPSASVGPSRPQKRRKTQKAVEVAPEAPVAPIEQGFIAPEPSESASVITAARRVQIPRGAKTYRSEDGEIKHASCDILLVALRSQGTNFREEKRLQKAFGVPLPEILKHEYFYELPQWVHPSDPSQYLVDKHRSASTRPARHRQSATPSQPVQVPTVEEEDGTGKAEDVEESSKEEQVQDQEMGEPAAEEEAAVDELPEAQESYERGARTPEPGKPAEEVQEAIAEREGTPSPERITGVIETPNEVPVDVEMADNTEPEVPGPTPLETEQPTGNGVDVVLSEEQAEAPAVVVPEVVEEPVKTTRRGTRRTEKPPSKRQPKRGAKKVTVRESPVVEEGAVAMAVEQGKENGGAMDDIVPTTLAAGQAAGKGNGTEEEPGSPQTDTTEIWPDPHIRPRDLSNKANDEEERIEW